MTVLLSAPPAAFLYFAIAGFLHFLIGWTFLNASQKKIGAARTSPLIGTNPLFAAIVAAVTLHELPSWWELAGIVTIVFGAYIISRESADPERSMSGSQTVLAIVDTSWLGLGAAFFWALSPIFIRLGLQGLPSPLLGVTVGVTASALGYAVILLAQRKHWRGQAIAREAWASKLVAGLLVGLSTWMRWVALDLAPVAVVLALTLISTPLVILLSPLISGKSLERVTGVLWTGTLFISGGALLLILIP
jgi:drug/metabolite transporter (DMT)-like permease